MVVDTARRLVQTGLGPTGWNHSVLRRPKRRTYWSTRAEGEHTGYHILNEWAPRGGYCSIGPQQRAHYIHVDDGVILGTQKEKELVNEDMNRAADALESVGFVVKDRTPAGELDMEWCATGGRFEECGPNVSYRCKGEVRSSC